MCAIASIRKRELRKMGEWMQRAALIEADTASVHQRQLATPGHPESELSIVGSSEPFLLEPAPPESDYRQHPEEYELLHFVIPAADGPVAFQLAVPKGKCDAFAILELFILHHGSDASGQDGAKIE